MKEAMKNHLTEHDKFAGTTAYVIVVRSSNRAETNKANQPCVYQSIEDAEYVMSLMVKAVADIRTIRVANADEKKNGVLVKPKRNVRPCLVTIYTNVEARRFAISSTASNETEFVTEYSYAFCELERVDSEIEQIRTKELTALVVDLCCKYRGYKADKVQSRTILVAGDLDSPAMEF